MKWYRSLMAVVLSAIAVLMVSCGGNQAAPPPTYTPDQLARIESYASRIEASQDRLPELLNYVQAENWANIDNFIHGPLGELRSQMIRLANQLLPEDQLQAKGIADRVTKDLEIISAAVVEFDRSKALSGYGSFARDLNDLLETLPAGARPQPEDVEAVEKESVYDMVTPAIEPEPGPRPDAEDLVRQPVLTE